ncbi:MAG: hypothetical protein INR71_12040 [Terriglobus roseus]|nr:hypothetical protein [Terriglobus roseus]
MRSMIVAFQSLAAEGKRWQACVVNFRGCAGVEVSSHKLYQSVFIAQDAGYS